MIGVESGGLLRVREDSYETIEDKDKRLRVFNEFLEERHLKNLDGVGDSGDPKIGTELMRINSVYEVPKRFFTVVTFGASFWGGAEGEYSLIFKANGEVADGSIFITEIEWSGGERMFVLMNQYRISHNKSSTEVPRGFADLEDGDHDKMVKIGKLESVKLFRELYEETGIQEIRDFDFLGKVMEDSSTSPSDANVFFVRAKMPKESSRALDISESSSNLVFKSVKELFEMVKNGGISDMHSLSAIMKAITNDERLGDEYAEFLLTDESDFEDPENSFNSIHRVLNDGMEGYIVEYIPAVIDMIGEHFDIVIRNTTSVGFSSWWNKQFPKTVGTIAFERDGEDNRILTDLEFYLDNISCLGDLKTKLKVIRKRYPNLPRMTVKVRS